MKWSKLELLSQLYPFITNLLFLPPKHFDKSPVKVPWKPGPCLGDIRSYSPGRLAKLGMFFTSTDWDPQKNWHPAFCPAKVLDVTGRKWSDQWLRINGSFHLLNKWGITWGEITHWSGHHWSIHFQRDIQAVAILQRKGWIHLQGANGSRHLIGGVLSIDISVVPQRKQRSTRQTLGLNEYQFLSTTVVASERVSNDQLFLVVLWRFSMRHQAPPWKRYQTWRQMPINMYGSRGRTLRGCGC